VKVLDRSVLGVGVLIAGIVFVAVSYYKRRNATIFLLSPKGTELSNKETGRIIGYEQRMMKDGRLFLWLRAASDITFEDGHHELENVNVAIYSPGVEKPNQITANRAIYDQANDIITFRGNVKIETKEALKVATESLIFATYLALILAHRITDQNTYTILFALALLLPVLFHRHARSLWLSLDHLLDPPRPAAPDHQSGETY